MQCNPGAFSPDFARCIRATTLRAVFPCAHAIKGSVQSAAPDCRPRLLELWTTRKQAGIVSHMKAVELVRIRITYSETAFAELLLWQVPKPVAGSAHRFKYRLAYVVRGVCVLRYDNEAGKGDHRHFGGEQGRYTFATPEQLVADFERDIARWNSENSNA
jgi:hypothetical protein